MPLNPETLDKPTQVADSAGPLQARACVRACVCVCVCVCGGGGGGGGVDSHVEERGGRGALCSLPASVSPRERGEEGVGGVTSSFYFHSL